MGTAKDILSDIAPFISFSEVSASYFGKGRSWLGNKVNENIINGVRYHLSRDDVDALANAIDNLALRLSRASGNLKEYSNRIKKQTGRYFTTGNPFNHPLFFEWYQGIPNPTTVVEPFAGACNIPRLLNDIGIEPTWKCYDILPLKEDGYHVVKRDCIANMPKARIIITNPPFLAKNSAKRQGLQFPNTSYQDIYLYCLEKMLTQGRYVAAILPESFISSKHFQERLYGVVSLKDDCFADTTCPVCLALFSPSKTQTFKVYSSHEYLGEYSSLVGNATFRAPKQKVEWKFNAPTGSIGVQCVDRRRDTIRFFAGEVLNQDLIVDSSRSYTRIQGLPTGVDKERFISICNVVLDEYRRGTRDILLTSFKGKRADGYYRRRVDFGTIKDIMDTALFRLENGL